VELGPQDAPVDAKLVITQVCKWRATCSSSSNDRSMVSRVQDNSVQCACKCATRHPLSVQMAFQLQQQEQKKKTNKAG
jgi:hypothetical protein